VYDLFGDGRTAINFSANKYEAPLYDALTNGFNPIRSQSASLTWNDLKQRRHCARERDEPRAKASQLRHRHARLFGAGDAGGHAVCDILDRPNRKRGQLVAVRRRRPARESSRRDGELQLVSHDVSAN
jgi:hypothetical protein